MYSSFYRVFKISFYYFVFVLVVYCGAPVAPERGALANDTIWYDRNCTEGWRYKSKSLIERPVLPLLRRQCDVIILFKFKMLVNVLIF